MTTKKLTRLDVNQLLSDSSSEVRIETAKKIAGDYDANALSDSEKKIAEEIFRLMVKDAEVRVRESLSIHLKENSLVPHDVALSLASDVETVALPMLQFSEVLDDADLIEIVRSQNTARQTAIARRDSVSETVSTALVDSGDEAVVTELVTNVGANISEQSLQNAVNKYGESEPLQSAMVHRPSLPVTVAERLVGIVSENLKGELVRRHELPGDLATDLILQSRERATISLSSDSSEEELVRLVAQLHDNGRLSASILLRALCMGDINFFEHGLAHLADVPLLNVRTLIHDSGELGLKSVYDHAGMPESYFPAVRAAIDIAAETEYDGGENDRERYSRRMIERILTQYGDLGVSFESEDLEYLLAKMGQLAHDKLEVA